MASFDLPPVGDAAGPSTADRQVQGNLGTILTSYNDGGSAGAAGLQQDATFAAAPAHATPAQIGSDLSITIDFRERSSTLGSIGDLGSLGIAGPPTPISGPVHIVGGDGAPAPASIGSEECRGTLGAVLESHGGVGGEQGQGRSVSSVGSPRPVSASTPGSVGSGSMSNPLAQPQPSPLGPPAVSTESATTTATATGRAPPLPPTGRPLPFPGMLHINHGAAPAPNPAASEGKSVGDGPPSQPSSPGSTSAFLSGNFVIADGGGAGTQQQQPQQQGHQITASGTAAAGAVAHTPPSAMGPASYEARHFGKRMRAGSICGRLRSASDAGQALEDKGIIDRQQRGILKDLIIAGDDALQSALDRFEEGDSSALESMIKSGKLQSNNSADIDILGDLDLDFLTVGDDDFGRLGTNVGSDARHHGSAATVTKSAAIPISSGQQQQQEHVQLQCSNMPNEYSSGDSTSHAVQSSSAFVDDGIGELDFNGEYSGAATEEELHLPPGAHVPSNPPGQAKDPPSEGRLRANSLAFGSLLNEPSPQQSYGNWMDRHPTGGGTDQAAVVRNAQSLSSAENIVGANGSLYIIHSSARKPPTACSQASAAEQGASSSMTKAERTKNDIKQTVSAISRLEQAAERRREKQEKRELREREKRERKERRERETKEKKEREAREKQERKERKEAAARAKHEKKKEKRISIANKTGKENEKEGGSDEEPKEIESGTGRPRSLSDPNLTVGLDNDGLLQIDHPEGWVGAYSPDSRKMRIERFLEKRNHRVWTKKVKYDVRKNFADSRLRVKGRFVKKEDELLMRDLMSLT